MNNIHKILNGNKHCVIEFTKLDGTRRVIICTTDLDFVPETHLPKGTGRYDTNRIVKVFDIVAQEWRSVIIDNITYAEGYKAKISNELLNHY